MSIELLRSVRDLWERFGVMPGPDSLRLLVPRYAQMDLTDGERAFLFVAIAIGLDDVADEDALGDLEYALCAIADDLAEHADRGSMAAMLGVDAMRAVSVRTLGEIDGVVLGVARLAAGVGPERTLYAVLVDKEGRSVEVVIKPGQHRVALLEDSGEALDGLRSWSGARAEPDI